MADASIMVNLGDPKAKEIAEVIGNKTANKILDYLAEKDSTVSEVSSGLGIPLNTADYNVKKLLKAGLIEKSGSWWSVKGKKMPTYKVSNKKIVISPKNYSMMSILMIAGILGALAILLSAMSSFENQSNLESVNYYSDVQKDIVPSVDYDNYPDEVMLDAKTASASLGQAGVSEVYVREEVAELGSGKPVEEELSEVEKSNSVLGNAWIWFLIGAYVALVLFFVFLKGGFVMDNSVKITGIIAVAIVALAIIGFLGSNYSIGSGSSPTVSAEGTASVYVTPDEAYVYFNVETNGSTAEEAKNDNAVLVEEVRDALKYVGFSEDDIWTQNFNVYEDYDWTYGSRKSLGYKATHTLVVKLRSEDTDRVGVAVDAGVDAGAMLNYINLGLSTELENQYKAEAMKLATQDARTKAGAIAEGLGLELGDVVSTGSSDFNYYPYRAYSNSDEIMLTEAAGAKIATEIDVGEQEVTATISVTYKLKD